MSEHVHDCQTAVTAAGCPGRTAVQRAVGWLRRTTDDVGTQPLMDATIRRALKEWPVLTGLSGWAAVTTWRSLGCGCASLCHDSYCIRYRNTARSSNSPYSSLGNAGFGTVCR